jgi:hypothetical protein
METKQNIDKENEQQPFECSLADHELSDAQLHALWSAYPQWDELETVDTL